jgi:3-oxoacyl-[acyl-carrier-protein] synthase-3
MNTYITSLGKFLPNDPIPAEEVEQYVGAVGSADVRDLVLKNSGIRTRHFAIDKEQRTVYKNGDLAARAILEAVERSQVTLDDVSLVAVGSSAGDYAAPALANMVHGELMDHPVEVVATNGFCACGMMALRSADLMIRAGEHQTAVACGSELTSRQFKSSRYTNGRGLEGDGKLPFDVAFLRYMLSDGAGAVVLRDRPASSGLSYRIEWITMSSFAHSTGPCMYVGSNGDSDLTWQDYPTVDDAAAAGALSLRQNMRLLPRLIRTCAREWKRLIDEGKFDPDSITRVAMHFSSEALREPFRRVFAREGVPLLEDRWYTNLHRVGNIGCAAVFVMLEELDQSGELEAGDQILCFVPESGRFSVSMMLLTAVEGPDDD